MKCISVVWTLPLLAAVGAFVGALSPGCMTDRCCAGDHNRGPGAPDGGGNPPSANADRQNTEGATFVRPAVHWELIDFRTRDALPSRRAIKSVCLVQHDLNADPSSRSPPPRVQVTSDDPVLLNRLEIGFNRSMRSALADLGPKGMGMGNAVWGELRITTTQDNFVVYIYQGVFALDTVWDGRSWFQSWTLARLVDDLIFGATKEHLSANLIDGLSGESRIRHQKERYEKDCRLLKELDDCTSILASDKNAVDAYRKRAEALLQLGQCASAIADYNRAIALVPKDPRLWFGRGNVFLLEEKYQQAIGDFTKAIELNPKLTEAYRWRGMAYEAIGDSVRGEADKAAFDELRDRQR